MSPCEILSLAWFWMCFLKQCYTILANDQAGLCGPTLLLGLIDVQKRLSLCLKGVVITWKEILT